MSMKTGFWRWALVGVAAALFAGPASANLINDPPSVTTDTTAGLLVYPKIVVDTSAGTDTIVQMTNTAQVLTRMHCFYVNANGHCSNAPSVICNDENFREVCPGGGVCEPGWQETDFNLTLTKRQPISWSVSNGRTQFPIPGQPGDGIFDQTNQDSLIPPVPEDPFRGELRCIQVDPTAQEPIDRNDIKGEATVVTTVGTDVDARKYTAIGIPAIEGAQDGDPSTLNLGGPDAEYNGCPNILTLNHLFDGADVTTHNESFSGEVESVLTVVPCAADFLNQDLNLASATLQFLIYNEFEQRFSTSTGVECWREVQLADIDTRPGPSDDDFSIFSAGVQGTLAGQTRIRSVTEPGDYGANGVIAVIEEDWDCERSAGCTAAANVQYQGTREQGDQIRVP